MKRENFIIIFLFALFISMPAFAIENVTEEHKSTNLTEMSDYTGDTFFKSKFQIEEERQKEQRQMSNNYYHQFRSSNIGVFDYSDRKTMPPLKKLRLGIVKAKNNITDKYKKQAVDEESVVSEEENSVLQEEAAETQLMVKCKTMKYLPDTSEMEATGNVEIKFPSQDTTMYADRMTYNTLSNVVQLYDNVKIVRSGSEVFGEYIKVDLNEESGHFEKPRASDFNIDFVAENGYMFGDTIVAENGRITSNADNVLELRSSGFCTDMQRFIVPKDELSFLINDMDKNKFLVKVNEIKISAKDAHDTVKLKNPKIYSNKTGKKILSLPSMTFYTNKEHDYFEGNYPEIGSYSGFGMFAGPGIVFETPFGSTLKVLPTVNYKKKLGFGGVARFKSGTNQTEGGYNTASQRMMLKGYQRLDDHLVLQYGINSYIDNWFLGHSWAGYGGELVYEKGYTHKDFLYDKATANFLHRISAGIFRENERGTDNLPYLGYNKMSTARFKYMAEYNQRLYSKFGDADTSNNKGWKQFDLKLISQGSAALYGTGDTQFIGRIGPRLETQYKFWRQELGYFLSGYDDNTPMVTFDSFRYGRSNVYVREYLRLHKFLTLGLYGSYNLSDDVFDFQRSKNSQLREATIYTAIGPDDFKINLGYDFIRQNTYFGLSIAMNTKGSTLDFKKMEVKNYDNLGKTKGETNTTERYEFVPPPSPFKTRAVVENIEDETNYMKGEPL